ncbi:MAG: hypothetical protein HYY76_02650 [Acidobacteria bacterium]|nr:hypothetical protein [Acidobacteriota bacterium]
MAPPTRPPSTPFARFCECLNRFNVDYLVVGSEAVAFHGVPRYSLDFDVFVRPTKANLFRVKAALEIFGLTELTEKLDPEIWARTRATLRLGEPPFQIDVMLQLSGVEYEQVGRVGVAGSYGDVLVRFIALLDLIRNKRAAGREKDLADIKALEATAGSGSESS